eukprot:8424857-Heterocapsa_arctica.AAC.1
MSRSTPGGAPLEPAPRLVATAAIYSCPHCDVLPFRTSQAVGVHLFHKHKAEEEDRWGALALAAMRPGALDFEEELEVAFFEEPLVAPRLVAERRKRYTASD